MNDQAPTGRAPNTAPPPIRSDTPSVLAALAEAVPGPVFVVEANGLIVYANRHAQQCTGQDAAVLAGRGWLSLVHPQDHARVVAAWEAAMQEGQAFELQCRLGVGAGPGGEFQWRVVPAQGHDGGPWWAFTGTPVGEPSLTGAVGEDGYRWAFAHAAAGLARVAADGRFLAVNERFCHIVGYSREQLLGSALPHLTPALDIAADEADAAAVLAGTRDRYTTHKRFVRADGSVIDLMLMVGRVPAEGTAPGHFVYVIEDVQARNAHEAALLEQVLQSSPDPMWIKDLQGRWSVVNAAAAALTGQPRDALPGLRQRDTGPAQYAEDEDRQVLHDGDTVRSEVELFDASRGEPRVFLCTKVPLRAADGSIAGLLAMARDITERKAAEEHLRRSHDAFYALVQNCPFGVVVIDADLRLRQVSLGAHRLFAGIEPLLGRDYAEVQRMLWSEAAASEVIARVAHTLRTGEPYESAQTLVRRRDRDEVGSYDWRLERVKLPDGRFGVVAYFYDLSERLAWVAALRESRQQLTMALQAARMGVFDWDPASECIELTKESIELFGLQPGHRQLSSEEIFRIVHPDDVARHRAALAEAHARGLDWHSEYRVVRPHDGKVVWIEERGRRVVDVATGRQRIKGVHWDVTARRFAQERLQGAFALDTVGVLFWGADFTLTEVNDAFLRMSGFAREEALGKTWQELTPPEFHAVSLRAVGEILGQGEITPYEKQYYRKDGSRWWGLFAARKVGDEVLEFVLDVSAHKRAEAASRAKSAFLANMSHEIRTPMNAILGLTHLLSRDGLVPRQAEQVLRIEGAARHLLSVINDILDLSRIDAGKLELEERDFELPLLLEQVRSIVGADAAAKGLRVEVDAGALPQRLRGDDTRLRQALLNYAGNAVKFTPQGRIALRARLLEEREGRLLVRFEVEDTGVGVDPQQLPRLFEAFEQADASTTREHGGTGLGLAITRRLAELMGGSAGAEALAGGSLFWFTAWLGRGAGAPVPDAAPARADAALRQRHASARLLLVEDNFINREVALALLRAAGLQVDIAEDGRAAVEKVRHGRYDLVLMDMQMPVMDGLQATRALRAIPGLQALPVLAMTANAYDEDRAACLAAGMDDFVTKPVEPQALYATLLKWLDRAPSAPAGAGSRPPEAAADPGAT